MTSHCDSENIYNVGDLVGDPLYPADISNLGIVTRVVETLRSVKYEVIWQKPNSHPFCKGKMWDHYELVNYPRGEDL